MAVDQGAVNDLWICKDARCAGQCDDKVGLCQYIIAGTDAPAEGGKGDVVYTENNGTDWTNSVGQPFDSGEHIISIGCFQLDSETTRWIAVRDTDGANPLEIAYSDDGGANFTNVDVESAGTRGAVDSGALFILDPKHIWLAVEEGYIFFSSDGGITWSNQEDGTVTAEDYYAIMFVDSKNGYAVAGNGIVVKSTDGGLTWTTCTTITGTPRLNCLFVFDKDNVMLGDAVGEIWRTWDGGTTWTEIYTSAISINDIDFYNDFVGMVVKGQFVLRTRNGGEDWEVIGGVPANTELNCVVMCNENYGYVGGEDETNAGMILTVGSN